jgi:hypothetical protein
MLKVYLTEIEMFQLGCYVGHWPASEWAPPGKPWNWMLPSGPPYIENDPCCEGWTATRSEALSKQEKYALEVLNPYRCKNCSVVYTQKQAQEARMKCVCGGELNCILESKPKHSDY